MDDVQISDGDLKIEAFRTRPGPSTSTADSAVRVTHLPTGIVIEEDGNGSQIRNRAVALQRLRERLAAGER